MHDPVNILVVDDLTAQRLTIEAALAELGERIVSARTGREALKFLLENEAAVILLDVNMPGMDGFETAALIRQRPRNANTPIIFLTADHDAMQAARGYALGAVDYLTCPFLPDVLRTKVKVFVSLSRARDRIRREAEQRMALLREQAARAAAEEQNRRMRLLGEAGGVIMRSLEGAPFHDELLRVLVPALADEATVRVVGDVESRTIVGDDGGGGGAGAGGDGEDGGAGAGDDGGARGPADVSAPLSAAIAEAFRSSAVVGRDPDENGRPRTLALPMVVRGHHVAVLAARRHHGGGYTDEESDLLGLIAGRAAVALDNRRLYQELQERDRRKDEFLAMLSHELRNPLGAITAAARLLEMIGTEDEHAVRARQVVSRQSAHLTRIVDDLLDVSRVTAGRITLTPVPLDLREVVERTLDSLRASGRIEHHAVDVSGHSVWVVADAARMEQVLTNLIVNATKYTDRGGRIAVEIDGDDARAFVRVVDDGIGITAELLHNMFDVFVQGGQALDRAQGGLGIGLTLVRKLMELQGGSVRAASAGAGRGSTFTLELPRHTSAPHPAPVEPPAAAMLPLRVLLVDDNADAREVLRAVLELQGHHVDEAGDGPSAVEAAARVSPDLALVDLGLPGFDGLEVARRLQADARTRRIVLVALTGYGRAEDRERTARAGFAGHLVKPVTPERLDEAFALTARLRPERLAAS